ncbi:ATP-binding protein [Spongiactinospora sp. TRM90649]|uniref:ATP-binding protein n=1 Tax=Spongiactinospora sp. TRM90649 TaxID=3031114 RepID=UPI0023F737E4|nr:ATP-binding protein [Spongiactinospora sp. TRM90649]MDF5752078.1 ATP-binding protein [Spongiactinospora sp. TRM90649]
MRTLRVPATVSSLGEVAEFVGQAVVCADLGEKDAYRLRLATDELVTNVITHGFRHRPPGDIELQASISDGRVLLMMVDTAGEFDPTGRDRAVPPAVRPSAARWPDEGKAGGFGLALVRMCADRILYERVGDLNRTIIVVRRSGRGLGEREDR